MNATNSDVRSLQRLLQEADHRVRELKGIDHVYVKKAATGGFYVEMVSFHGSDIYPMPREMVCDFLGRHLKQDRETIEQMLDEINEDGLMRRIYRVFGQ